MNRQPTVWGVICVVPFGMSHQRRVIKMDCGISAVGDKTCDKKAQQGGVVNTVTGELY